MNLRSLAVAVLIYVCVNQHAFAVLQAYEGFDYSNTGANLLASATDNSISRDGGLGWAGPWRVFGTTEATTATNGHRLSQDDVSLDSAAFPFSPIGDRVISKGIGPGNNTWADRTFAAPFNFSSEGEVRYFSFLFQKDTGAATAEDNMEVDFWSVGTGDPLTQVRFGSNSSEQFFFNNTSSPTFKSVSVGQPYFVVLKLESHAATNDTLSAITFAPSDTVPVAEPTVWESSRSPGLGATIAGIRLWIGVQTTGEYDEIRMGTSWADVAVAPAFPAGDYNHDGMVDAADYVIWRKNPGGQFGPGDYDIWRQNFGVANTGAGAAIESATVPEPAVGLMLLMASSLWIASRAFIRTSS
jgi:hypothetical protein